MLLHVFRGTEHRISFQCVCYFIFRSLYIPDVTYNCTTRFIT